MKSWGIDFISTTRVYNPGFFCSFDELELFSLPALAPQLKAVGHNRWCLVLVGE